MRIDGARVLVTGGTRGIGRALAEGLLDANARVVISGRDPGTLAAALASLEPRGAVRGVAGDVAVDADAARMVAAAQQAFGGLDVVVNNAAILTPPAPVSDTPPETWRAVLDVNVVGTANVIRHALPLLEAGGGGVIVNVSSTWGRSTAPGVAPYCASKFAVEALTQALAQELAEGVVTVAVNPGVIDTEMLATAFGGDVSMYASPASLVPAWLRLLEQLDASWNGRSIDL